MSYIFVYSNFLKFGYNVLKKLLMFNFTINYLIKNLAFSNPIILKKKFALKDFLTIIVFWFNIYLKTIYLNFKNFYVQNSHINQKNFF